jgi:hypothetical protein
MHSLDGINDNDTIYLVDEVILLWASEKFKLETNPIQISDINAANDSDLEVTLDNYFKRKYVTDGFNKPEHREPFKPTFESKNNDIDMDDFYAPRDSNTGNYLELGFDPGPNYYSEDELKEILGEIPNCQTNDIIRGYFNQTGESTLNYCVIDVEKTTPNSLTLAFEVKPADKQFFRRLSVLIPNHETIECYDKDANELLLDGLYPNSEYALKILVESKDGTQILHQLKGITLDDVTNFAPQPEQIARRRGNALIGMKF